MIQLKSLSFVLFVTIILTSCNSHEIDPNEKLVGTWEVTKVEGRQKTSGNDGIVLTDNNPTGSIIFEDNGTGKQDYSFTLWGNSYPNVNNFFWTSNDSEIIIDLWGDDDMIWARSENSENKQIATYDIVVNEMLTIEYTLTLER